MLHILRSMDDLILKYMDPVGLLERKITDMKVGGGKWKCLGGNEEK